MDMARKYSIPIKAMMVLVIVAGLFLPYLGTVSAQTSVPEVTIPEVKIGVVGAWTGADAMNGSFADQAIRMAPSILAGLMVNTPLRFIKYDTGSNATLVEAGVAKLVSDNVSAIVGGATDNEAAALAEAAEKYQIPFFNIGNTPVDLTNYAYTTRCIPSESAIVETVADLVLNKLKPKTAVILADDSVKGRDQVADIQQKLEAGSVQLLRIVYLQQGIIDDLSPFVTVAIHSNSDLVLTAFDDPARNVAMLKQIAEFGGWGNIRCVSMSPTSSTATALTMAGADGTYHWAPWIPGLPYPGAEKFEVILADVIKKSPSLTNLYYYLGNLTAIQAIQLSGSDDRQTIAKYARAGNLTWNSPCGPFRIGANGENNLTGLIAQVESGQLIPVENPTAPTPTPATITSTPTVGTGLDINSTLGELLANPQTEAIIHKYLASILDDPALAPQLLAYSNGQMSELANMIKQYGMLTDAQIQDMSNDLEAIKGGTPVSNTPTPQTAEPVGSYPTPDPDSDPWYVWVAGVCGLALVAFSIRLIYSRYSRRKQWEKQKAEIIEMIERETKGKGGNGQ